MFLGSLAFYFQPGTNWSYVDALFMAASSVSNCGLNTITTSELTTWHIIVIYLFSCLGSHIVISIIILYVRRHYFSKRFEDILIFNKAQRLREANKRKFIRDMEKSTRKSDHSLRKRLSFLSVLSVQKLKDEEDSDATTLTANKAQGLSFPSRAIHDDTMTFDNETMINFDATNEQKLPSLPEYSAREAVVSGMVDSHPGHIANCSQDIKAENGMSRPRYNFGSSLKSNNDHVLHN
jgi:hypothetical protein